MLVNVGSVFTLMNIKGNQTEHACEEGIGGTENYFNRNYHQKI